VIEFSGLFGDCRADVFDGDVELNPELGQWMTPEWVAQLIVERYFASLSTSDLVVEPSCGLGAFMKAVPDEVPVFGVEVDPVLAQKARENTGREVLTGDFAQIELPSGITTVVGNPPFSLTTVEKFLTRAHRALPQYGRCGLILPCYHFQTFGRVNRWSQSWGIHVDMIPRGLFPGIRLPLAFCVLRKDAREEPVGLAFYAEAAAIGNLTHEAQEVLSKGRRRTSVWRALIEETLHALGGRATLEQVYRHIEPRRPTSTAFWREKVRQQLQRSFVHCGPGEWALNPEMAAA